MKAKLFKKDNYYKLFTQGFLKGSTNYQLIDSLNIEEGNIRYKLSLKNCQAIELGYDLDELAEQNWRINLEEYIPTPNTHITSFKAGFQKALEILGDKKFSEKNMFDMYILGGKYKVQKPKEFLDKGNEIIKSLQQTEWDVEIAMECHQCQEWGYVNECRVNCNKKFLQPKLDSNGCLILKRV